MARSVIFRFVLTAISVSMASILPFKSNTTLAKVDKALVNVLVNEVKALLESLPSTPNEDKAVWK